LLSMRVSGADEGAGGACGVEGAGGAVIKP
jgi:hypothetical protein